MSSDPADRFLEEAVARGALTVEQAADCRRVLGVLAEVEVPLSVDEVACRKGFLDQATADEIKRALARKRVGKYEVLDRLGEGGGGVVWRARDAKLGRVVALKLLSRPGDSGEAELTHYRERFRREARVAVTLNHVNIVRGLDFGEADGYIYFAMEFVAGESVAVRLRREGRLPEAEALRIALETVRALAYVQRFALVHRDIKPGNLLITPDGDVKVCDFGLARPALDDPLRSDGAKRLTGTPVYMSPEQIRDVEIIDWRADVYGLGATLYHMLTGRPPFDARGGVSVIHRHLTQAPRDPREAVLELSQGASAVVLKMLAKQPERRYASLDDLASDLAAVLDGRPPIHTLELSSSGPGAVEEALADLHGVRVNLRGRRRTRAGALAAAALLVAAGAWWGWDRLFPPELPRDVSRGEGQTPPATDPPAPDPRPVSHPPTVEPRFDPGRAALARAHEMEDAGDPLRDVIKQYEWVVERYAEHPSARRANARAQVLRERLATEADGELASRVRRAEELIAGDRYGEALALFDNFPRRFSGTAAADRASAKAEGLRAEGGKRADTRVQQALDAARRRRFDEAESLLESAATIGIQGALDVEAARFEVAVARQEHSREFQEQAAAFAALRGDALLRVSDESIRSAHLLVDRAVAAGTVSAYVLPLAGYDVDDLRRDLEAAEFHAVRLSRRWRFLTERSARVELEALAGGRRQVAGQAAGFTESGELLVDIGGENVLPVAVRALSGRTLLELLQIRDEEPLDRRALVLYALAVRDFAAARELASLAPPEELTGTAADELLDLAWAAAVRVVGPHLERADEALLDERLVVARGEIAAALAYLPGHAPALTRRGELFLLDGRLDEAEQTLRTAVEAARPDVTAHVLLARVLERRGRLAAAEAQLRLYLDKTADAGGDRVTRRRTEAQAQLEDIVRRRVEAGVAAARTDGRSALRRRERAAAEEAFRQVLSMLPDDAEALLEVGLICVETGRQMEAFRKLRHFIALHPDYHRVLKAVAALDELDKFRTPTAAARDLLRGGNAALEAGRVDEAVRDFDAARRAARLWSESHHSLARALLARGRRDASRHDFTEAEQRLDDALLLTPDLDLAVALRAEVRFELGRFEDALSDARDALVRRPDRAGPPLVAARCCLALDRLDDAITFAQNAFRRRRHADPLYYEALALERQGKRLPAFETLDRLYHDFGAPKHLEVEIAELFSRLEQR